MPFSGVFYPIYKQFQTYYAKLLGIDPNHQSSAQIVLLTSLASFSANIFSCTLTHPIDLIRTRIYFQFYNQDTSQQYSSISDAVRRIYQLDGPMGYFRGLLPRIMRKGAGSILAWAMYEYLIDKKDAFIKMD